MPCVKPGQGLDRGRRREESRRLIADEEVLAVVQGRQSFDGDCTARRDCVARRSGARLQRGVDDRPVAGAAAQIAGERVVYRLPVTAPASVV